MLLMPNTEKCTRRHAGGNSSISVRLDRVTGPGFNDLELQTGVEPRYLRLRSRKTAGVFIVLGVFYV